MNLVDSFAFLFKTNAKEAQRDVEAFDKSAKKTQDTLNSADKSASALGLSFSKLALAGVAALEGFAGLNKLKENVVNAINFNAEIEKTAKLTNINARELTIWNDVIARAGGNPGSKSYLNFISNLNDKYAALGVNDRIKNVNRDLLQLSDRFRQLEAVTPGSSEPLAAKLGIDHDLWLALTQDIRSVIAAEQALDNTTDETAKSSLELKREWVDLSVQGRSLLNDLIPIGQALTWIASIITKGWSVAAGVVDGVLGTLTGGKIGGWQNIDRMLGQDFPGLFPELQQEPPTGTAPTPSANAPLGIRNNNPGNLRPGGVEASYPSLNAGVAAEQRQLGIYGRRGWNTLAAIASHWAPPGTNNTAAYIADLARRTGFNPNEPLNLNDPSVTAKIANAINAHENGNAYGGLIAGNGQLAAANATSVPPAASSNQKIVTIGQVTINTQASDAKGIATDFHAELASTVGSYDDGVKY